MPTQAFSITAWLLMATALLCNVFIQHFMLHPNLRHWVQQCSASGQYIIYDKFRQMSLLSVGSEATGEGEYTHRMHERGSSKTQFWSMYQELICPTLTLGVTLVLPVANPSWFLWSSQSTFHPTLTSCSKEKSLWYMMWTLWREMLQYLFHMCGRVVAWN